MPGPVHLKMTERMRTRGIRVAGVAIILLGVAAALLPVDKGISSDVIGVMLVAEGFEHKVPKGYIYFAMAFSVAVEMLNIRMRKKKAKPVKLHEPYT